MKHQTVSVQIESILQASPKSYEVRWSETALDMSSAPLGTSHWEAILETEVSPQSWTDTVINNPLGFYVTRLRQSLPKSLKSVWEILERAIGIEPMTSSLGRAPTRVSQGNPRMKILEL